jgi:hypothetical protein
MKLLRYGPPGQEKSGLLDANGRLRDLSAHVMESQRHLSQPRVRARPSCLHAQSYFVEGATLLEEYKLHFELNVSYTQMDDALEFLEEVPKSLSCSTGQV